MDELPAAPAALHDLASLLDSAQRCAAAGARGHEPLRQLAAIDAALAQAADLLPALGHRRPRALPARVPTVPESLVAAADLMRPLAEDQGITLALTIDPSIGSVPAPGLLRALTDVIRNAVESIALARCVGAPGSQLGHIHVGARCSDGAITIEVTDDGVGPPATPRANEPEGRGLGLTVASYIVRRLRGSLSLTPANPDTPARPGAVLRISIPVSEADA